MEGIAKSPPQNNPTEVSVKTAEPPRRPVMFEGVPMEFISHFNLDIRNLHFDDKKQLTEIFEMMDVNYPDMGDMMTELGAVERRLGQPTLKETRFGRVWNYLKLQRTREQMSKRMEAMEHGQ